MPASEDFSEAGLFWFGLRPIQGIVLNKDDSSSPEAGVGEGSHRDSKHAGKAWAAAMAAVRLPPGAALPHGRRA